MLHRWPHFLSCYLLVSLLSSTLPLHAEPKPVSSEVRHVTLYRGQALVARTVTVEGEAGEMELVVSDLPQYITPTSLYAEGGEDIEVRAVRYRTRAVGQEPREEVRKIEQEIAALNRKIQVNNKMQALLAKRDAYLDKLEGFVAPTAKTELSKGVLDAEALQQMTTFSFAERKKIAEESLQLETEAADLHDQVSLLQRRRDALGQGNVKEVREAVLFVQKRNAAKSTLQLNYLVSNCGWSPTYTFRASTKQKDVSVEYNALIQQLTGEDWEGISLTLSTAVPGLSASGPTLAPFEVGLNADVNSGEIAQAELRGKLESIQRRQDMAIEQNFNSLNLKETITSSWAANSASIDFQCLELNNGKGLAEVAGEIKGQEGKGPSLTYQINSKVSLASRADQQMVRIMDNLLKREFYYVATPLLTSYVYREAELVNSCPEDLLTGPISVYLDGRFVGRSELPTVARGQTFVVGFGADPQLRARRELVSRDERLQGGNRVLDFQYRLQVENYKDVAIPVRLMDRLPYGNTASEIRVTIGDMTDKLSDDTVYLRHEKSKGILRWPVEVPANAAGESAKLLEYSFSVEFDREYRLSAKTDNQQQLEQYEEQYFNTRLR